MRVRDLRWYILTSIIIIISYAALAFSYYTSIESGKVLKSMKAISMEITKETNSLVNDHLGNMFSLYVDDYNNKLVEEANTDSPYRLPKEMSIAYSNFTQLQHGDYPVVLASRFDMERITDENGVKDTTYYFYFMKDEHNHPRKYNDKLICRVPLKSVFDFLDDGKQIVLFEKSNTSALGQIHYTNVINSDKITLEKSIISALGGNIDKFLAAFDDYGVINRQYTLDGEEVLFTGVQFTHDHVLAVITSTTDAILGLSWVKTQSWIFFVSTVIVTISMLVILVLGCRKASKLLRADRHAVQATLSMVIRIDLNGKVIFTNKTFKKMYGTAKLLNVDAFLDVETNEPIINSCEQNRSFECQVMVEDTPHYLHLSPLLISRSYYLMGNEITTDYKARKHLEIMSGKNENTHCDNGFMLANQYEKIIEGNLGYDIAFIEYNIYKYDEIISIFGRTSYIELLNQYLGVLRKHYADIGIYHMTDSKFIVVLPNKSIDDVTQRVTESMKEFKKPINVKENNIYVRTKVVVYNVTQDLVNEADIDEIKTKLDLAYRNMSQLSSKDFIVYDPVMDSVILAADVMEHDIEVGLENDEFEMYLQPQFDMITKHVAGFEALIRWNNPKYKDKSPQAFIELAEQRGHMLDIGKFVVRESFKLAKKLEVYKVHVSVNVSPVQLLQVGFVQQLIDEANMLDLNPQSIAVEITETLLMENFQLVNEKLKLLKSHGFTIHLDDFCTGYSSMQYLKDLPVDTIKIDKGFTEFIETSKVHEAICKTICNLANSLGLGIVCEGVENEVQAEMMKKMGCRVIQGFLIGKAVPYDEAIKLIEKYKQR